ncbi:MAG: hypothetical protein EOM24_34010 [Chloroflexia bacterium]|nr:hypothetical protein [Chloroflexia bacterium]
MYLTAQHEKPPASLAVGNKRIPTAPLIRRGDMVKLVELGIYPHHPNTDPAPMGTQWILKDGEYYQRPIGAPDEIAEALADQASAEREAYLDSLQCTRLQGKLALIGAGLWDAYETMLAASRDTLTPTERVFVDDAVTWRYRDPVLQDLLVSLQVIAQLQLTEEQVVGLFEMARSL